MLLPRMMTMVFTMHTARAIIPTTFGQAMHHHHIPANFTGEYELFARHLADPIPSQMTYFWMTCGGADGSKCFNLYQAIFRYYVDGEAKASVELPHGLAHGVGGAWEGPGRNESSGAFRVEPTLD